MSTPATSLPHARRRSGRPPRGPDPILDDLRAFAQEKGIVGSAAMERDELVESLRQRYLLETMLKGRRAAR